MSEADGHTGDCRIEGERPLLRVYPSLLDPIRDAVAEMRERGTPITLAGQIALALQERAERLRAEHNGGQPFPVRKGPLRTRRPRSKVAT